MVSVVIATVMADDGAVMVDDAAVVVEDAAVMALLVVEDMLGGQCFHCGCCGGHLFVIVGDYCGGFFWSLWGTFAFSFGRSFSLSLWEISFDCCGGVVVIVGGTADLDIVTSVRFTSVDSQTTHTPYRLYCGRRTHQPGPGIALMEGEH